MNPVYRYILFALLMLAEFTGICWLWGERLPDNWTSHWYAPPVVLGSLAFLVITGILAARWLKLKFD